MTLGDNIKYFRKLNGMSQQAFAEKMQTTQQRVSEWERGKVEPSLYNLMRMLKVFSITFEELTEGLEERWSRALMKRKGGKRQEGRIVGVVPAQQPLRLSFGKPLSRAVVPALLLFPQNSLCDFCGSPEKQESTCSPLTQGRLNCGFNNPSVRLVPHLTPPLTQGRLK